MAVCTTPGAASDRGIWYYPNTFPRDLVMTISHRLMSNTRNGKNDSTLVKMLNNSPKKKSFLYEAVCRPFFLCFTDTSESALASTIRDTTLVCFRSVGPDALFCRITQLTALRNARQDHATLRPIANRPSVPQGASRSLSAAAVAAAAKSGSLSLDGASAIGRQLLGRRVPYADFDALPDPQAFQLHRDLQGWTGSPSRLDFLYKELVRQRNAAVSRSGGGGGEMCGGVLVSAQR